MKKDLLFPKDFKWASASSAFQVEGGCELHDFYDWALKGRIKDKTNPKDAVFFWTNYKKDIALMKKLNHNAVRIGLEWARIEPQEGVFDKKAIATYRDMLLTMKKAKIAPMVTIHHFSNPMWLAGKGGWSSQDTVDRFLRYTEKVVQELGDLVDVWITVNEPNIYAMLSRYMGTFPPGEKNFFTAMKVQRVMADAHIKAYAAIHRIHTENKWAKAKVGVASHLRTYDPFNPKNPLDRLAVKIVTRYFNDYFLNRIGKKGSTLDIFGINYYSGDLVKFPVGLYGRKELFKNKLGWDIYPEGLYRVVMTYWNKYRLPVYITENGTCDENDELRPEYIVTHLAALHKAIQDGADVAGYYHWSTMDNFELVDGLMSRFGLIHVDHQSKTKKRTIKPSGKLYASIAKNNGIPEKVLKQYGLLW